MTPAYIIGAGILILIILRKINDPPEYLLGNENPSCSFDMDEGDFGDVPCVPFLVHGGEL